QLVRVLDRFQHVPRGIGRQGDGDLPELRAEGQDLAGRLPDPLALGRRQVLGDLQQAVTEVVALFRRLPELLPQGGGIVFGHPSGSFPVSTAGLSAYCTATALLPSQSWLFDWL